MFRSKCLPGWKELTDRRTATTIAQADLQKNNVLCELKGKPHGFVSVDRLLVVYS